MLTSSSRGVLSNNEDRTKSAYLNREGCGHFGENNHENRAHHQKRTSHLVKSNSQNSVASARIHQPNHQHNNYAPQQLSSATKVVYQKKRIATANNLCTSGGALKHHQHESIEPDQHSQQNKHPHEDILRSCEQQLRDFYNQTTKSANQQNQKQKLQKVGTGSITGGLVMRHKKIKSMLTGNVWPLKKTATASSNLQAVPVRSTPFRMDETATGTMPLDYQSAASMRQLQTAQQNGGR